MGKPALTSFSLAVALRVVENIADVVKGTDSQADVAFQIVIGVLRKLTAK